MIMMFSAVADAYGRVANELRRLAADESGQDLVEYALLLVFIALATMASMQSMTGKIIGVFNNVGNVLTGNA
jgi:Flp pilus assembly pilin Flp